MKKLEKQEAEEQIKDFFSNLNGKTSQHVKKIKKLAMRHNIHLDELRKKFCKRCLMPYNLKNSKDIIRIKKNMKIVKCGNCGYVGRWKMKG